MNYHFTPSPRPSSLEMLTDEQLFNIYELAVQAKASPEFIEIIEDVLTKRRPEHYESL
ncbi:Sporulation inhibitor A [Paenibacillus sophorae]|uniref:Sporulation histidine kinase inhibitor Sda n=1 Tax=Paenibacillus sophorae TaxID=1333845 RepID=A0A1H8N6V8_9BACL|nr:sporulation histidine kinase inhibitor Sda [Paenibacillus sophorae]QWU14753.1 sporulation histidine kinase inhibitor Sda [Paenibacillus sophorae]SEO25411.1 Sporulation inhibitor A [Paenibacillus sophorae]